MRNSIDAVADRDFALDYLYAAARLFTHLSRIGEEISLWATAEFGFARLPEAAATGSSMMPQKLNPDVAELARGKAGTAIGRLTGLLATVKGLPLAYDRDLQEDKTPVFATRRDVRLALEALTVLVSGLEVDRGAWRRPPPTRSSTPPTLPRRSSRWHALPRRPRAGRGASARRDVQEAAYVADASGPRPGGIVEALARAASLPGRSVSAHEKRIEIRWRDVDAYLHVNNAVYATYLEEGRDEWLERTLGDVGTPGTTSWLESPSTFAASFGSRTRKSSFRSASSASEPRA